MCALTVFGERPISSAICRYIPKSTNCTSALALCFVIRVSAVSATGRTVLYVPTPSGERSMIADSEPTTMTTTPAKRKRIRLDDSDMRMAQPRTPSKAQLARADRRFLVAASIGS